MKSYNVIKIIRSLVLISIVSLMVASCLKPSEDNSALYAEQFQKMKASNNPATLDSIGYNVFMQFLDFPDNPDSVRVTGEDVVLISYEVYNFAGELLGTTYADVAIGKGIYAADKIFGPSKYAVGYLVGGLYLALTQMPENSKALILIPSEMASGLGPIKYIVELHKIIKNASQFEIQQRNAYIDTLKFMDESVKTAIDSSMWYKLIGNGNNSELPQPYYNSPVTIELQANYCEFIPGVVDAIPGRQFFKINNANDTITYPFENTTTFNNFPITPAIDSMVAILRNTGYRQAEFITSSANAYGSTGFIHPYYGTYIVQPHMSVHYNIKLIDIKE